MTLNTLRALLGILGGFSTAYAIAALIPAAGLTARDFGVGLAISAACVIGVYLVKAIESDRERMRQYREQIWQRRIDEGQAAYPHLSIIKGGKEPAWLKQVYPGPDPFDMNYLKPWPIGDDEVQR